jgi:hypothetical protein
MPSSEDADSEPDDLDPDGRRAGPSTSFSGVCSVVSGWGRVEGRR